MQYQFWATVVLSVALVVVFVGAFYFTYGSSLEAKIVANQMGIIMTSLSNDITDYLAPDQVAVLSRGLQDVSVGDSPSLKAADEEAAKANEILVQKAIKMLGIAFAALMLVFGLLVMKGRSAIDMRHVAQDAFGGLGIVALTYWTFMYFFASKFMSADPQFVKLQIVEALQRSRGGGSDNTRTKVTDATSTLAQELAAQGS